MRQSLMTGMEVYMHKIQAPRRSFCSHQSPSSPPMQRTSSTTDIVDLISTVWRRRRSADYDDDETYFDSFLDYVLTFDTTTTTGEGTTRRKRRRRSVKRRFSLKTKNNQGQIVDLTARNSIWWLNYVECVDMEDAKFLKIFRNRFRLPYQQYLELVAYTKTSPEYFKRWFDDSTDVTGERAAPLEILVLGVLRYLGRGWTFDDLWENTGVHAETHRQFFHKFIEFGSNVLYARYVDEPMREASIDNQGYEMNLAGFHGAVASSDATHIVMEKCKNFLKQYHSSPKTKHTSRTYNIAVNHRRRILSTTSGHPGRWNDKTIVLFDDFVRGIHDGRLYNDAEFELLELDAMGNEVRVRYRGAWILVDNGYLNWSSTIAPFKKTTSRKEHRWSEWIESMRKDVECTFGILKGRWRILKSGTRVHGHEATDRVWKTCCALHNWLLDIDGLDERWMQGVPSPWEGELGQFDAEDLELIPEHIRARLELYDSSSRDDNAEQQDHLSSSADEHNDEELNATMVLLQTVEEPMLPAAPGGPVRIVRKLSHDQFRSRLVDHFDILFKKNEIKWPRRLGARPPTMPHDERRGKLLRATHDS